MTTSVPIGEFSRLTHLSVKTLHHYHDIGLLPPASTDPSSGYRRYATTQVPVALLIRRLRDLDMPIPLVREVVASPDAASRDRALRVHLDRMETELARTREVVASLRTMLTTPATDLAVELRVVPAFRALTIRDTVGRDRIAEWCGEAFPRLAAAAGAATAGPSGATYDEDFFAMDSGEVVAFVPVLGDPRPAGAELVDVPAGRFAVAVHAGPFTDIDRTYGALGSYVAEHCTVTPGPIRELYVVGPGDVDDPAGYRTELCWPITD